jgi:hypothetical protein
MAMLRVNGLDSVTINAAKGFSLGEYTVTTTDRCGNRTKVTNSTITISLAGSKKKPPISTPKLYLSEGTCNLGSVLVNGPPGEYTLNVSIISYHLEVGIILWFSINVKALCD